MVLAFGFAVAVHAAEDGLRVTSNARVTEDAGPVTLPGLGPEADQPRNRVDRSGIRLLRSEPGVEVTGVYHHSGQSYQFTARLLDDGARLAVVRHGGEELARAYHGADGSLAIILGGLPVRGLHLLEPAQRPMVAALIASKEAAALRDLALEIGCAEPSEESRPLRNVLQAIVIDGLQPWGLKIDAAAVEGVAERCPVLCDAPLERDGLMLLCGQALFRLQPAGQLKSHNNCFGACGSGCSTCFKSVSSCVGDDFIEVYDCYTEECCVDHDECNRRGWCAEVFGHTCNPLCHLEGVYNGCFIHAFTGADFYSYRNVAYTHVYPNHWMCVWRYPPV